MKGHNRDLETHRNDDQSHSSNRKGIAEKRSLLKRLNDSGQVSRSRRAIEQGDSIKQKSC